MGKAGKKDSRQLAITVEGALLWTSGLTRLVEPRSLDYREDQPLRLGFCYRPLNRGKEAN